MSPISTALHASWAALHTFQYGLAIAGLNGIQAPLTCGKGGGVVVHTINDGWLQPCIPMSSTQFGIVVSIFTLGGLLGALSSTTVTHRVGSVGTLRLSAAVICAGSIAVGLANSVGAMIFGRVLVGIGCGFATTTVPLVLAELAPSNMKRSLGIMNQLFIVIGILTGQALAFPLGKPYAWRWVLAIATIIAIVQLVGSAFVKIGSDDKRIDEDAPLLDAPMETLSIAGLLKTRDPRICRPMTLVLITQLSQQICGVSAVMYFSTRILSPVFEGNAKLVALIIVILKVPITVSPAFLIERLGTRPLLIIPTSIMAVAALFLAIGINADIGAVAAIAIVTFVAAFSVGLGPVTWVILGEVMPINSRAAASSIGLAVNWTTNFVVGASFLPLQHWLSGGSASGEGNIFYVFMVTCLLATFAIRAGYKSLERIEN